MDALKRNRRGAALALAAIGALSAQFAMAAPKKVPAAAAEARRPMPPDGQAATPCRPTRRQTCRVPSHQVPLPRQAPPAPADRGCPTAWRSANCRSPAPAMFHPAEPPRSSQFAVAPSAATSPDDIAAVKRVIEAARKGRLADADTIENGISDPVARKLAEWIILRSDNTNPSFARYAAFVSANPSWPHAALFRRRAENALWNDNLSDAEVLAFFADHKPRTAKGRYMLARALLAKGDRDGAAALVRYAWRHEDCTRRHREQGARDVRRHAHARRPQGAHGATLLCRRRRSRHARRDPARRRRSGDRSRPRGGDQAAEQCQGAARRGAGERTARSRLYLLARAMAAQRQQAGRSRQADPHRAARSGRDGRSRSVVAGTAHPGAQAARRRRSAHRLLRRARRRPAGARLFPRRSLFHRRLDRAALPARSEDRRHAFRAYRRRFRQSLCAFARRLLARPRRRGYGSARAG